MGCGASSSKGSAPSGPALKATGSATQPQTPSKQTSDLTSIKESDSSGDAQSAVSAPQPSPGSSSKKGAAPAPPPALAPPATPASPSPPAPPAPAAAAAPAAPKEPAVAAATSPSRSGSTSAASPAAPSRAGSSAAAAAAPGAPSRAVSSSSAGPGTPGTRLPPLPADSGSGRRISPVAVLAAPADSSVRPVLQVARLVERAPVSCLAPPPKPDVSPRASEPLPAGATGHLQQLASAGGSELATAAAHVRQLLCGARPPVQALLDAGAAAALVRCLQEGPQEAKLDAAWALTNIAASPVYAHVEALGNAEAPTALLAALGLGTGKGETRGSDPSSAAPGLAPLLAAAAAGGGSSRSIGSGARGSGSGSGAAAGALAAAAAAPASPAAAALREQALWALANIAGALHPELKTQVLAAELLDLGALGHVIAILTAEEEAAAGSSSRPGSGTGSGTVRPIMRCAAWCLHNLAKHKREKDMVNAIPLATRLLSSCPDPEVLTCLAWVLAYLGSNEDNKSHMKQALPALPRLVPWVRAADTSLATPALLCTGTMCTGYMRSLDYSGEVVEAGGVPAFLSYLRKGQSSGRRDMVMDALFALSNVAGANNATVQALLEAGAFGDVISLLRSTGDDEEMRMECLYVLTNAWDPLVGAEVNTVQRMLAAGILEELDRQLEASAPSARLDLLLKGLTDGLKRGQMVMTYTAGLMLVELGREGAAAAPPPANPVVELYSKLGTVNRITALNSHPNADVATKANGILTVLKFMS